MPDLQDRIYCSEQIHIPPTFPYIMKLYCKAAIRTQPYDLLKWSAAYFRALANGEEPPVKERVEYPPYDSPSGLTPGYIKILINQFGKDPTTTVTAQTLFRKWSDICLDEYLLIKLIALLGAYTTVNWVNFVGICAGFISKTLTQTMTLLCELFTEEPEGGMATVPYGLFVDLYIFLAQMNCGPLTREEEEELEAIMEEEDICEVADKIKRGEFVGETRGEYMYGEDVDMGEGEAMLGEEDEDRSSDSDEAPKKAVSYDEPQTLKKKEYSLEKGLQGSTMEVKEEPGEEEFDNVGATSDISMVRGLESSKSIASRLATLSRIASTLDGESTAAGPEASSVSVVKFVEEQRSELEVSPSEEKTQARKINLEDLEDSIRQQIEEKLAAEEESVTDDEEREFEELSSYLLGAAARVQKFTAETLGFKIFKRYMRQEVPGIGPVVDPEQVEKVVDFMDFWSHKQEMMVMPRNIRHWMCPPLELLPTPQP